MNKLNIKRIIFIITIIIFIIINIIIYSNKYDILARYQYKDKDIQKQIKDNLNYEEINYIIKYAIDPTTFIDIINNPYFNIYNINKYNDITNKYWQLNKYDACTIYELSIIHNFNYELYIDNTYHKVIIHYLEHKDKYINNSKLELNPNRLDLYLDNTNTISILENTNLHKIPLDITNNKELYIDNRVIDDLVLMCKAISKDLVTNNCANTQIIEAYKSYVTLEKEYNDALNNNLDIKDYEIPGHSEHQLGLAINLKVKDVSINNFDKTIQYKWFKNNAHKYGFIFTYTKDTSKDTNINPKLNHLRYIGKYNSKIIYDNNITLKELNNGN